MKKLTLSLTTLIASLTLFAGPANALNITVDGETNTINYAISADRLLVGEFDPESKLTVSAPSGSVDVTEARIGDGSDSDNNELIITDAGSIVTASGDLHVGFDGSGNSLHIENGGTVSADNANMGFSAGSDGNSATVTGTDSLLSVADTLHVGRNGAGNRLTVESNAWVQVGNVNSGAVASVDAGAIAVGSGGEMIVENSSTVNSDNGYIGLGSNETATATVSGSRSTWNIADDLHVGYAGTNNTLTVKDGAVVNADNATIGTLQSASNNTLTVTGSGSALNAADTLLVGDAGSLNTLDIKNGAAVGANDVFVGNAAGADGNTINITGSGSMLMASNNLSVTSGSNNTVNINNGGVVYVGNTLSTDAGNQVNLNSGGTLKAADDLNTSANGFNFGAGSTVEVGGTLTHTGTIEDGRNIIINGELSTNDASWTAVDVRIGETTAGNSLTVTGGGTVTSAGGVRLGVDPGTDNNTLTVTGSNSTLTSSGLVIVGQRGQDNKLDILNGGNMAAGDDFWIGENPVSADNTVIVSGSNSALTVQGELHVGKNADGNGLNILDGGSVSVSNGVYAGSGIGSDNNTINVSGSDSTLAVVNGLTIGEEGANNSLNVSDSGTVDADLIVVGEKGGGNSLQISSGATVDADAADIGIDSDNNAITVSGSNSAFSVNNLLTVGATGSVNSLTITGGSVSADDLIIGQESNSNSVAVAGTTSTLTVGNSAMIGNNGTHNSMAVSGGASVTVSNMVEIGAASSNNSLIVSGSGTRMDVLTNIVVGDGGNSLAVEDSGVLVIGEMSTNITNLPSSAGGVLSVGNAAGTAALEVNSDSSAQSGSIYLGADAGTSGSITVSGSNAALTATDELHVGLESSSNKITITNGGSVTAGMVSIGTGSNATGNSATLTGSDSKLEVSGDLYIGNAGDANSLLIEGGATATVSQAVIGNAAGSDSNSVSLSGSGSTLDADTVVVGQDGSWNSLNITNGAVLAVGTHTLYINAGTGSNNTVNLNRGGTLQAAGDFNAQQESFNFNAGSTLEVGGALTSTNAIEGERKIVLNGGSATWQPGTNLYVGGTTTGNSLTLLAGAMVNTITGYIGQATGADSNAVTVAGSGSTLTADSLTVGMDGSSNVLDINSSGTVFIADTLNINSGTGTNNQVLLNSGGTLQVAGDFNIQALETNGLVIGSGSTLEIGGTLTADSTLDNGSQLIVNGGLSTNDALWNAGSNLVVGAAGTGSVLTVSGGGAVNAINVSTGSGDTAASNSVNVTGTGSTLTADMLSVGTTNNAGNTLNIGAGGTVLVNASLSMNTNNQVNLDRDGTLAIAGNFDLTNADTNGLNFNAGGILRVGGTLTATNAIDGERNIVLNGGGALWNVGTNLSIGATTADNSLSILNGGSVTSLTSVIGTEAGASGNSVTVSNASWSVLKDLLVGGNGAGNSLLINHDGMVSVNGDASIGAGSANNSVAVNGSGSTWGILGSLMVGNGGTGNSLLVDNGGMVTVGNDLMTTNGSIIDIGSTSGITVGSNYNQDATSTLKIGAGTNSAGRLTVGNMASFESSTTIEVYNDGSFNGTNDSYDYTIVDAGTLLVAGTNATTETLSNEVNIVNSGISSLFLIVDEDTIRAREYLLSLAEATGTEGSMLGAVADDIDEIARQGGTNNLGVATRQTIGQLEQAQGGAGTKALDNYYGQEASSAPIYNLINQSVGSFASELRVHGDNARERAGIASTSLNRDSKPAGPAGPFNPDQGLQGWFKGYGTWVDKAEEGDFGAYDGRIYGTVLGFDFPVAENILLGFAGGYSTSDIDKDNNATSDAKTRFAAIYTSVGTEEWFFDGSAIYGGSDVSYTLGDVFDTEADYDTKNYAFYIGGGREMIYDYMIVTPELSVLANYYEQNAYEEESTTAVPREVDAFDTWYLKSSLGCNIGMYMGVGNMTIKPEVRLHWIHEFNADEETLPYRLVGGTGEFQMTLQAPEEDILQLGAGISAHISEYLKIRLDADLRAASGYSDYGVSGKIRYQF